MLDKRIVTLTIDLAVKFNLRVLKTKLFMLSTFKHFPFEQYLFSLNENYCIVFFFFLINNYDQVSHSVNAC